MRIRFSEISPAGSLFKVEQIKKFKDSDIISFKEGVKSEFLLKRKGKNKAEMTGSFKASPVIKCDRCLTSYSITMQADYHIVFEHGNETWKLKEVECSASDMETVTLDVPEIDIDDILRQQVLLHLPEKRICSEDCLGICHYCGNVLNESNCQCKPEEELTVFATALLKARKKKK